MASKDKPVYMISVVAQMLEVHPQTLRLYEREGLVRPSRTDGNTRLYSQEDVERVLNLTRQLGVNLAGVDIILRLQDRLGQFEAQRSAVLSDFIKFCERHLSKRDPKMCDLFLELVQQAGREGVLEADKKMPDEESQGG